MNKQILSGYTRISVYPDPFNKRLRVDDYEGPMDDVLRLIRLEVSDWVEKLIIKSRPEDLYFFLAEGFMNEAFVKNYFNGTDMHFVVQYLSPSRGKTAKWADEDSIMKHVLDSGRESRTSESVPIKFATAADARDISNLYKQVFKVYPTPITDENFVNKTIEEGTVYAFIRDDETIISVASAEINAKYKNAELTDCASLKAAEGRGHMKKLITKLEERLIRREGITCLYSIARAQSFSMNKVFYQLGYEYSGRLINNCVVYSGIEDMNVWWKKAIKV